MPKQFVCAAVSGLLLIMGAVGCGVETPDPVPVVEKATYLALTSPENVLNNIQIACRAKNLERYAELLAPEFVFRLQPNDVQRLRKEVLTRDEDVAGMGGAFTHLSVGEIRINFSYDDAVSDVREGAPEGSMAIRTGDAFFEMDAGEDDVIVTWRVHADIEEFLFRPGNTEAGEDPARWFLYEWRDIPAPLAVLGGASAGPTPVRSFTWGQLKTMF